MYTVYNTRLLPRNPVYRMAVRTEKGHIIDRITSKVFSNIERRFLFKFKYRFSKPLINGLLPLKQLPGELLYSKENGRLRKLRIEADYKAQDVG